MPARQTATPTLSPAATRAQARETTAERAAPGRSSYRTVVAALSVGIVAILIAVAVILLSAGGSKRVASSTAVKPPGTTTQTQRTTTQSAPRPVTEGEAKAIAYEYAAAFSNKRLNLLGSLLTTDFKRTNAGDPSQNRAQALASYEKQFSQLTNPQYALSRMKVTLTHDTAIVAARYSISSSAGVVGGSISIDMVRVGQKLMINRIIAIPDSSKTNGSGSASGAGSTGTTGGTTGSTGSASEGSGSSGGSTNGGSGGSTNGDSSGASTGGEGPGGLLYYGPQLPITPVPNLG